MAQDQLQKILLVDDDPINLHVVSQFLKKNHFIFESVSDGKKAWEILSQNPQQYQLILIDRMMLGMDALDLIKHLKSHSQLKNIPVIIMTGEAQRDEHLAAIRAGAFDFIYKPIDEELLVILIKKASSPRLPT